MSEGQRRLKQKTEELSYSKRCLRTMEGKLLFGPCGERLAVDVLDPRPGFVGCIDFIHKMNVTELFTVECQEILWDEMEVMWYPTHMTMSYDSDLLCFQEKKLITAQDTAISLMRWKNCSKQEIRLTLRSEPEGFFDGTLAVKINEYSGFAKESPTLRFDIRLGMVTYWNHSSGEVILQPEETAELCVVCAVGNLGGDIPERMESIAQMAMSYLKEEAEIGAEHFFERLLQENQRFYEAAPQFFSDDRTMNACWKYRWYILKNSMCRPKTGRFKQWMMYEGRDHRMSKTPLSPKGWEFSKLIPLSTPLQVTDLRWHPYHNQTKEIIRSAFAAQNEDGLILSAYVQGEQKSYANYMIYAVWLHYQIDGDKGFLREMLSALKRYIEGHEKCYGNDRDSLLIEWTHSLTGKEYQPSYWYFKGYLDEGYYPGNPKDKTYYTPLKRVDRSVYHYLNLLGIFHIMRVLGENDAVKYLQKAERIRQDILSKMWDAESGFFYDLHYETDEKAYVRNIVGIYPFWAQMTEDKHQDGILPLIDQHAFHTGSGFASVSCDCPVFSPDGGWNGNFFKGRNGCVWCGPSWPYTTGIALEALGLESRKREHIFDQYFDEIFSEYTKEHFRDGDRHRPYLVEHYNPVSGERLSDEADYNHSYWIDLVIRFVAGINVEEDCIKIQPLKTHLKWWSLKQLWIRGHCFDISYEKYLDDTEEICVCMDHTTVYKSDLKAEICLPICR